MDDSVQTDERRASFADELTPEEYARLGRAMARVMFAAYRATHDRPDTGVREVTYDHGDVA